MNSIKVLIISAYPLLGEITCEALQKSNRSLEASFITIEALQQEKASPIILGSNIIIITMGIYSGCLKFLRFLKDICNEVPILIICTPQALPDFLELAQSGVKGVISTTATLQELEYAINALMDDKNNTLELLYYKALLNHTGSDFEEKLTELEINILELAAMGASDQDISLKLGFSQRTISNYLQRIYLKLKVRNRTEAVTKLFIRGIINPPK